MKINDIITRDGKEYKFVSVLEELQQKGMSSCALCNYRSHISACEFGIKNMCLPNHCLKLNEQPIHPKDEKQKMKLNELCFKVVTANPKRNKQIVELLFNKATSEINECYENAKYILIIASKVCFGYDDIDKSNTSIKEITFDEAIKLLESCKQIEKKPTGKFIEFDIDENGCYHPLNERGSSSNCRWQDIHHYEDVNRIFAGWFWENPDNNKENGWSVERQGLDSRKKLMSFRCEYWEYPLVPKKIRFWVRNNI